MIFGGSAKNQLFLVYVETPTILNMVSDFETTLDLIMPIYLFLLSFQKLTIA